MYILSSFVKVTVPNYLAGLPIPDSFGGWFRLGVKDWLALIPPTIVIGGISYYSYHTIKQTRAMARINPMIRLHEKKVVDFIEIEDIGEKMALCRCWKSKKNDAVGATKGANNCSPTFSWASNKNHLRYIESGGSKNYLAFLLYLGEPLYLRPNSKRHYTMKITTSDINGTK